MTSISRTALLFLIWIGLAAGPGLAKGTHPVTGEPLADDQSFTYRTLDEPTSLDPQLTEDVGGSEIVRDLFEGLFNQDENGELVPGVATGFDLSPDKKTYTFHLRDTARWSNGAPVTARDFVYAWRRLADPATKSPYQWFMELMSLENNGAVSAGFKPPEDLGVSAIDDRTLEVRLEKPLPYFPQMTVHTVTFPVPGDIIAQVGSDWTRPEHIVSNGAYVLSAHEPGKRVVRVRNPVYWDDAHTILDRVEARIISDEKTSITEFFTGDLDRTDVPMGMFQKLQKRYPDETVSFPRLCNYYVTFNLSDKGPEAFKDKRVRQALSLAIDREVITDQILGGGQTEAYTFTPPFVAGFKPPDTDIFRMNQDERDSKAKALLAEAGYGPGGRRLSFTYLYNTSPAHKRISEAIAQMWREKLDVDANIADVEWRTFLETRGRQDFDLARGAWCGDYNEASTFLDLLGSRSGYNDGKYANPRVDALLSEAKTADNPAPLYTEIEQILADEVPVIPIYHYSGSYLLSSDLKNWPVKNVEQNWYSKNLYKIAR